MARFPTRILAAAVLFSLSTVMFLLHHNLPLECRGEEARGKRSAPLPADWSTANQVGQTLPAEDPHHSQIQEDPKHSAEILLRHITFRYNLTALNNTRNAAKDILFFNRVPKVGSQTIMNLIHLLTDRNNFQFYRDGARKFSQTKITDDQEDRLTNMIDKIAPPSAYVKHISFSNFTRHGRTMPIYINFVRDPVERVISWFYYRRAPWVIVERMQTFPDLPLPDPRFLQQDFESCVRAGEKDCRFIPGDANGGKADHYRQAMFFCGHDDRCVEFDGKWAIQQAKRNVEEHYAVVGVLEEMDMSLQVLEGYIPRFFGGAPDVYKENIEYMKSINKNIYKPPVSQEFKEILRKNFTQEIEFYEFCKQRLHNQYNALIQLRQGEQQLK